MVPKKRVLGDEVSGAFRPILTARPFENRYSALYNLGRNSMPDAASTPVPALKPRRWSIMAAGLLLVALALVVIYTSGAAFFSPLALVVVAAIGLAALLLQLRLRRGLSNDVGPPVRAPLWLNVVGLICAIAAVFADILHLSPNRLLIAALGAVFCFAASGATVLHALRRKRI
jgi:peptidoglycan/LPS O-acetylase OafA/YrhL